MGIYWRNVSYWWVRLAPDDVSICRFFRRRSVGAASGYRNHRAHLHTYLPKHGNDDRSAPHHRCTIAINQLQRLLRANDHVWPWAREQRLDSPENSCVRSLWLVACKGSCQLPPTDRLKHPVTNGSRLQGQAGGFRRTARSTALSHQAG